MREKKERVLNENIWFPSSKGPFPGLERPLWQTCVMPSERGAHLHQPQRGRSRNPGATWGPCWPSPKQRNAWPQGGHFWCWQPFQGERWGSEAHTKTCQCTICNKNFQKARSLDVIEWSTAKNNLVPQGQWNRPYWSKRTVKIKFVPQGQSDRPRQKKRTAKNKLLPRSQQNRLHHKKVTKMK